MSYCRGCSGTCCTGVGSESCTCEDPVDLEDGRCDLCDRIERFGHWHYCPNNSMARQRGVTRENYSGNPFVPPKEGTDQ